MLIRIMNILYQLTVSDSITSEFCAAASVTISINYRIKKLYFIIHLSYC